MRRAIVGLLAALVLFGACEQPAHAGTLDSARQYADSVADVHCYYRAAAPPGYNCSLSESGTMRFHSGGYMISWVPGYTGGMAQAQIMWSFRNAAGHLFRCVGTIYVVGQGYNVWSWTARHDGSGNWHTC